MTTRNEVGSKFMGVICIVLSLTVALMGHLKPEVFSSDKVGLALAIMSIIGIFIFGVIALILPNVAINANPFK